MGKDDYIGLKSINNFGSKMEIVAYRNAKDIDIYFEEYDCIVNSRSDHFKDGGIKCPYEKRYYSVGYIGEGKYGCKEHKVCFTTWCDMLNRCYNFNCKKYDRYGAIGCVVCEEWHNFQNFAEWYYDNYYKVESQRMELDKDILIKGNKIYSPSTCIFVPQSINKLFTKSDKTRGEYPIGVSKCKSKDKIRARCNINGKCKELGEYYNIEEAFQVYKLYKENYIKQVAEEYKPYIPQALYDAMYRYEVEITD